VTLKYVNTKVFRGKVYIIFDTSGSAGKDLKEMYKRIYDHYEKELGNLIVIKHNTKAEISNIEEVIFSQRGGTYMSTGLNVAIKDIGNNKGNVIIQCCDGDNWSEDKEIYLEKIKEISKDNLYIYYETLPATFADTIIYKVRDIYDNNSELKITCFRILCDKDLDRALVPLISNRRN
jgi:uncharacterized sporulation protein YeaH/YhbH (DUF444 family)